MDEKKDPAMVAEASPIGSDVDATVVEDIYIDPAREKAALRKFDIWFIPVAFTFLVLSSLDRNNVGFMNKCYRSFQG